MSQPNQFTKAAEEGKEPPKGANQFTTGKRDRVDAATRDKMRAEHAALRLQSILDDEGSTKDQVIAAAKALLPYGKSTFSSVENIDGNPFEDQSEEEIAECVCALITAHDSVLRLICDRLGLVPKLSIAPESASQVAA